MACINILLDEKMIDVATKAIVEKMGRINSAAIVSGIRNEKMTDDYKACEELLNKLNKAKVELANQRSMIDR